MPFGAAKRELPENDEFVRIGAVLVLLYWRDNEMYLVLTKRREDLHAHAGQISFPGGKQEPLEPLLTTALRETEEEVGIPTTAVRSLGQLTTVYIPPSGFLVHPFVGYYQNGAPPQFIPSVSEVSQVIEVSLTTLLDPETAVVEPWNFKGHEVLVPYFAVQEHKVWGATAIMLSEFLERLRVVINSS
ncbi:MAG: coenzyme A pyrophosphatase [Chloroflexi bacterium]|nr:MAG: coenzyme A pyrophosphatase [Chloroflexota bacterium]